MTTNNQKTRYNFINKNRISGKKNVICFSCNMPGHFDRNCPTNPREVRKNTVAYKERKKERYAKNCAKRAAMKNNQTDVPTMESQKRGLLNIIERLNQDTENKLNIK